MRTAQHRHSTAAGGLGLLICIALGGGFGLSSGCYSERVPPSTYRYACDADGDCNDGEACRTGICERTCSSATAAEDCGTDFALCFNGACASTCDVEDAPCPSVQECIDLSDLGVDVGGGASPFGGSTAALGICGRMCEPGDGLCPDTETCLGGFCVTLCDPAADDECPEGTVCSAVGLCAPPQGATTGADDAGDSGGQSSDGATAGSESGGTQ